MADDAARIAQLEAELGQARRQIESLTDSLSESEAREQALTEIARIIAASSSDAQPVLDAVVRHAARLSGSPRSLLALLEGETVRVVAVSGDLPGMSQIGEVIPLATRRPAVSALRERRTLLIPDMSDPAVLEAYPEQRPGQTAVARLSVPLLHEEEAVGLLTVTRDAAHRFTAQDIALIEAFAAQAAVAVANARTLQHLEARNADLAESNRQVNEALERQTATAEILRIIASSPTDAQPVLDAVAESATRLSDSPRSMLMVIEEDHLRVVAEHGTFGRTGEIGLIVPLSRDMPTTRAAREARTIHTPDQSAPSVLAEYKDHQGFLPITRVSVPLRHESKTIGVLNVTREVARGFSERDIALLETFADQAAIAIANARLFQELEQRNHDLHEALEQQTATAEVLRVIASSPTDSHTVLDSIAHAGMRLCESDVVQIRRVDGETFLQLAIAGQPPGSSLIPNDRARARPLTVRATSAEAIREARTIHIPDSMAPDHLARYPDTVLQGQRT